MSLIQHINSNIQMINESTTPSIEDIETFFQGFANDRSFVSFFKDKLPRFYNRYGVPFKKSTSIDLLDAIFGKGEYKINTPLSNRLSRKLKSNFKYKIIEASMGKGVKNAFTIPGIYLERNPKNITIDDIVHNKIFMSINNGSIVSTKSNITPLICATPALIKAISDNELFAITLHEIGHWQKKTSQSQQVSRKADLIKMTSAFGTFFGHYLISRGNIVGYNDKPYAHILLTVVLGITFWSSLITQAYFSRRAEFDADNFAKNYGYGLDLTNALRGLYGLDPIKNRKELEDASTVIDKLSFIFNFLSTHPTLFQRSNNLLQESAFDDFTNKFNVDKLYSLIDDTFAKQDFVPDLALICNK